MLPPAARLRRTTEIAQTVKHGLRGARGAVVVHLDVSPADASLPVGRAAPLRQPAPDGQECGPARAAFAVNRAVGPAVVRNRVRRRLRALLRPRLAGLPPGARLVVRARPGAATSSGAQLERDLDAALRVALERAAPTLGRG